MKKNTYIIVSIITICIIVFTLRFFNIRWNNVKEFSILNNNSKEFISYYKWIFKDVSQKMSKHNEYVKNNDYKINSKIKWNIIMDTNNFVVWLTWNNNLEWNIDILSDIFADNESKNYTWNIDISLYLSGNKKTNLGWKAELKWNIWIWLFDKKASIIFKEMKFNTDVEEFQTINMILSFFELFKNQRIYLNEENINIESNFGNTFITIISLFEKNPIFHWKTIWKENEFDIYKLSLNNKNIKNLINEFKEIELYNQILPQLINISTLENDLNKILEDLEKTELNWNLKIKDYENFELKINDIIIEWENLWINLDINKINWILWWKINIANNNKIILENINWDYIIKFENNFFWETFKIIFKNNIIEKEANLTKYFKIRFQILETSNIELEIKNTISKIENINIETPWKIISIQEVIEKLGFNFKE